LLWLMLRSRIFPQIVWRIEILSGVTATRIGDVCN
jgi:hypothetical protein